MNIFRFRIICYIWQSYTWNPKGISIFSYIDWEYFHLFMQFTMIVVIRNLLQPAKSSW